jgi:glycerol-3-phosphate dehydrogenase
MTFGPGYREEAVRRLQVEQFDLVVVGGGITGAGVLRDAAMRGMRVALLERVDFGEGTSSRSSKLVHGGLRYLEQKDLALVHEGTTERARLLRLANPLVRPLPFLLPVHAGGKHALGYINLGMWLYDILGMFRNYRNHRKLRPPALLELEPLIRRDGLTGGILYYDAVTDDSRLTVENVVAGVRAGGLAVSRAEVRGVSFRDGRVQAVTVRDRLTGRDFAVRTSLVVSAAGVWTEELMGRLETPNGPRLRPTKGVHIVLPFAALPLRQAVVLTGPRDGRAMFTIPWHGATVVGTTDTDFTGPAADVQADRSDVDYLLETINAAFPDAKVGPQHVIGTWAGVRPLINTDGVSESQVSREHLITTDPRGIVAIAGGKLTTYRLMARAVLKAARGLMGERGESYRRSCTHRVPLLCGGTGRSGDCEAVAELARGRGLSNPVTAHLMHSYGARTKDVLDVAGGDRSLLDQIHPALPMLRAEVVHAARHEMAMSLVDVWCRRLPIFFLLPDQALPQAEDASCLLAKELGWDEARRASELVALKSRADAHMACVRG